MGSRGSDFTDDAKGLSKKIKKQVDNFLTNTKSDGSYYSWEESIEKVIPDIQNLAKIANEKIDFEITKSNSGKLGDLLRSISEKTGYDLFKKVTPGKSSDSGEKKNISLKNLFGKNKPAEPKVDLKRTGDSITMSNGEDSISMKLKIPAMQDDFHYFEPTNAVWSSSDPEKAAKMYVEAKKGYSYRSGSNGKIEILTPKGYVDFEISKS